MPSKTRTEADILIDQMASLSLRKQPLWFKEMFRDWIPGTSVSEDYSSPDGIPDAISELEGETVSGDALDDEFDERFDDGIEDGFDDSEAVEELEGN